MEQNEKKCFVHIENYTGEKPIVIIYREDAPAKTLDPIQMKMGEAFGIQGIISTPADWLEKHISHVPQRNSLLEVWEEKGIIKLTINLDNSHDSLTPEDMERGLLMNKFPYRSTVTGKVELTDEFKALHINEENVAWSPAKLAKFFRLNHHLFADKEEAAKVIYALKNVKAKIVGDYEKQSELHGKISKVEYMSQEVTHNLPEAFTLDLQMYKGEGKRKYTIEIDADVIDGEIAVMLVSPTVKQEVTEQSAEQTRNIVERIEKLCQDLAIVRH